MSARRLWWLLAAALLLSLALTWPLRLALDAAAGTQGLSALEVAGSIWSGRLRQAHWRGIPLGDVSVALDPPSLLTGIRRVRLAGDAVSATLAQGRVWGIEHAGGELPLGRVEALPGVSLRLTLRDASLTFRRGRCDTAEGQVDAEVRLDSTGAMPPILLAGRLDCRADAARVRFVPLDDNRPGVPRVEATVEIDADGGYRLQSRVQAGDAPTRLLLQAAGFQDGPGGLGRADSGRLLD